MFEVEVWRRRQIQPFIDKGNGHFCTSDCGEVHGKCRKLTDNKNIRGKRYPYRRFSLRSRDIYDTRGAAIFFTAGLCRYCIFVGNLAFTARRNLTVRARKTAADTGPDIAGDHQDKQKCCKTSEHTQIENIRCSLTFVKLLFLAGRYFPIQNVEKIRVNISSVVVSPVICPRYRSAL